MFLATLPSTYIYFANENLPDLRVKRSKAIDFIKFRFPSKDFCMCSYEEAGN